MNLSGIKSLLIIVVLFSLNCCNSKKKNLISSIIPSPESILVFDGSCNFRSLNLINTDSSLVDIYFFKEKLNQLYPSNNKLFNSKGIDIYINLDSNDLDNNYKLQIQENNINISAKNNTGIFYAFQSLIQLIALNNDEKTEHFSIPLLSIKDHFIFEHRGFLLDCCRHFFDIKTIKKYLDVLAIYKMNVFHWHLTEDQGWRIAIDKYPLLNSIGSWRKDSLGVYGGFYSKEELKEIVEYARKRHIEVIPEIELPGHSSAAIASYPNLSCNQEKIEVVNDWGVFKDIYCAGNDSVFIFIEDILEEVTEIFPSKLIHIGGDEAPKFRWEKCSKCQNRILTENLLNEHDLQGYFIERVAKILAKKNRTIIGWDEILESKIGIPVVIQSWRGFEGGMNAVKSKNKAIMSPTSHAYFDYPISTTDLEKVYEFNPIPSGLDSNEKKLIIGGECNLWSERIFNEKDLDNKAFPRLLAMSEVLWRNPEKRNYSIFKNTIQNHYDLLTRLKIDYGIEAVPVIIDFKKAKNSYKAKISSKVNGLNFKYKWLNNKLTQLNDDKLITIQESGELSVQAYKNKIPYGKPEEQLFSIHLANGLGVTYNSSFSSIYDAKGKIALVDGELGSLNFTDGHWQGFFGEDLNCVIAFDSITNINSVSMNFYQYSNSWVLIPDKILVYCSNDNENWKKVKEIEGLSKPKKRGRFIEKIHLDNIKSKTKFLKVIAKNFGKIPDWHEAAGSKSWLFIDEITVE